MRWCLLLLILLPFCTAAQEDAQVLALESHRKTLVSHLLLDPRSPIDTSNVGGLRFFPYVDSYVVETIILPLQDTTTLQFPTSNGRFKPYRAYARLYFQLSGSMRSLVVYESLAFRSTSPLADRLFLPFYDDTNGDSTYGGGRYLEVSKRAIDERNVVLDFNRSYNPWCAYGEGFSCPVPPVENRLNVGIPAGEAAFVDAEARLSH